MDTEPRSKEEELSLEDQRNKILDLLEEIIQARDGEYSCSVNSYLGGNIGEKLKKLRTGPFAVIVTKILAAIENTRTQGSAAYRKVWQDLSTEVLAVDISPKNARPKNSGLASNPIVGELVDAVSLEINRRVAVTVEEFLRLKGIGGPEITEKLRAAEDGEKTIADLRAKLSRADASTQRVQDKLTAATAELERKTATIADLFRMIDGLEAQNADLRKSGGAGATTRGRPHEEFLTILAGPISLLGITSAEVLELHREHKDEETFKKKLRFKVAHLTHPDKLNPVLKDLPEPSLREFIMKVAVERSKHTETAIAEIWEQLTRNRTIENKWKYKKIS